MEYVTDRKVEKILDELIERYPVLSANREGIAKAYELLKDCYDNGGKLMIAGNGGSAADSEHITGELMKGFVKKRRLPEAMREALHKAGEDFGEISGEAYGAELAESLADKLQGALPAIALTGHDALTTAYANDVDGSLAFAQQLYGFGKKGDVFLGISTSGNSKNVLAAALTARALGIRTIVLTGGTGGKLAKTADCAVIVPASETFKIQELHLPVYHALCLMLEETYFEA